MASNPIWLLPAHAPGSMPPYKYYPSTTGGDVTFLVFLYLKYPITTPVSVTLTSDEHIFNELPGGTLALTMTEQSKVLSLTAPHASLPAGSTSLPVVLTATKAEDLPSKALVQLYGVLPPS